MEAAEAMAAEAVITEAADTAAKKLQFTPTSILSAREKGGCKSIRLSYCHTYYKRIPTASYAILFTARLMRETFLAEVFLW